MRLRLEYILCVIIILPLSLSLVGIIFGSQKLYQGAGYLSVGTFCILFVIAVSSFVSMRNSSTSPELKREKIKNLLNVLMQDKTMRLEFSCSGGVLPLVRCESGEFYLREKLELAEGRVTQEELLNMILASKGCLKLFKQA